MSDRERTQEYYNRVSPDEELYPQYCGKERCLPGHAHGSLRREYLFHYILSGKGRVHHGDEEKELSEGDGFLIHPDQNINYRADMKQPWHYVWVGFTGSRAGEYLQGMGIGRDIVIFRGGPSSDLTRHFLDLVETIRERKGGYGLRAKACLYNILAGLPSFHGRESIDRDITDYCEAVRSFIQANFHRSISVQTLADYAGLDRRYLTTLFKQKTGQSLSEYLIAYRMDRAVELLRTTDLSIAELGQSVGYRDYPAFARAFRRQTGRAPSDFRR